MKFIELPVDGGKVTINVDYIVKIMPYEEQKTKVFLSVTYGNYSFVIADRPYSAVIDIISD